MVAFVFSSKFWEGDSKLRIHFCQSVSAVLAVSTLIGNGDTHTLIAI